MYPDRQPTHNTPPAPCFPEARAKFPWLSPLLHAYHIADQGLAQAIAGQLGAGVSPRTSAQVVGDRWGWDNRTPQCLTSVGEGA